MTPTPPAALHTDPVGPRRYALALLPLALLGLIPAWAVALLCGLYALGVWKPAWAEARLLGSLLIAGAAPLMALPGLDFKDAVGMALMVGLYVVTCLGVALLHWAANELSEGKTRGIVPVLALGMIAPQPGLLLALIGGLLARPGQDGRRVVNTAWDSRIWVGVLVAGVAVLALALTLPGTSLNPATMFQQQMGTDSSTRPPPAAREEARAEAELEEPELTENQPVLNPIVDSDRVLLPLQLGQALLAVMVVLAMIALWRGRVARSRGHRPGLADTVMTAGLLLTLALWFAVVVYIGTTTGRGSGPTDLPTIADSFRRGIGSIMSGPAQHTVNATPLVTLGLWTIVGLSLLVSLGLIVYIIRFRQDPDQIREDGTETTPSSALPGVPPPPLHRVRVAYREAEKALAATGRTRWANETPAGFADRMDTLDPELRPILDVLTRAYEPVRYGGHLTEEDAEAAEAATRDLRELLPRLPSRLLDPPDPLIPSDPAHSPTLPPTPEATP